MLDLTEKTGIENYFANIFFNYRVEAKIGENFGVPMPIEILHLSNFILMMANGWMDAILPLLNG